jgi:GNAT superfamily N-acetyltransferase
VTDEPPRAPAAGSWWVCLVRGSGDRPTRLVNVESTRYHDGGQVELGAEAAALQIGDDAICTAILDDDGDLVRIEVAERFAPKAPPLWFAELRESSADPPAVVLVAFTGADQRPGTVVDRSDLSNIGVRSSDQLAALRWYPATGMTDQLYVQPQWRRRNIASALLAAGEMLCLVRGWPRFSGDGHRTEMGERARNARSWAARTADLTHTPPPMTPGEAAELGRPDTVGE